MVPNLITAHLQLFQKGNCRWW